MRMKYANVILTLSSALWAFSTTPPAAWAQQNNEVLVNRKTVPVASIKDPATIKFFVDQFFITEDKIDSMEVIDILGDGFNEQDVLEVYPSKRLINLSESDTALAVMRGWRRSGFIELVGQKNKKTNQIVAKSQYSAATAMFAGMVRLAEKTYNGNKLNLFFDFDGQNGTASLQIWGFRDDKELNNIPKPLDQFANDLLFYTRTDTVYVDKPVYDVIYIDQTVTDTVYVRKGGE